MADELELISTNAAADSWVDNVPSAISTGYQNQNVAMAGLFNGLDKSSVAISGSDLIIYPSSIIDVSGLPFVVKTQITLALPTTGTNHYLKVVAGSTSILKEIEFTTDRGTYDTAKNGFYNASGERVLNWLYNYPQDKLVRISGLPTEGNVIKKKIIEIGDWDMTVTRTVHVAHGLDDTKIRGVDVIIRDDYGYPYSINYTPNGSGTRQGGIHVFDRSPDEVQVTMLPGGAFDNIDFDSTSYNRGWVNIEYECLEYEL